MTQEGKQILLKDLCSRLPYGVKATTTSIGWNDTYTITGYANDRIYLDCPVYDEGDEEWLVESIRPYLRPLSSMTEEEKNECFGRTMTIDTVKTSQQVIDWLVRHHFDFRGLIPMKLALEAPADMYKF